MMTAPSATALLGSLSVALQMAKSEIHAIHVWQPLESLMCQRIGRRENDVAINNLLR
jgi:hypothetical protein